MRGAGKGGRMEEKGQRLCAACQLSAINMFEIDPDALCSYLFSA